MAVFAPELQQRLVVLAEGLDGANRASALRGLGAGVPRLAPELQQRLAVLAESIDDPEYLVMALAGLRQGQRCAFV
ncbi:hypothetical protein, partial [Mesorhizobium sp.]|uniref:hypothetical protein n=1 Tax=Mesorhizobium sp. TaxID=1871066 RepID=UPI00257E571E